MQLKTCDKTMKISRKGRYWLIGGIITMTATALSCLHAFGAVSNNPWTQFIISMVFFMLVALNVGFMSLLVMRRDDEEMEISAITVIEGFAVNLALFCASFAAMSMSETAFAALKLME